MLLVALALTAPAPSAVPPRATARVTVSARVVRPVRVAGARADAREVVQLRTRPGLVLVEFQ